MIEQGSNQFAPDTNSPEDIRWRFGVLGWALFASALASLAFTCRAALTWLWNTWTGAPEYSHGPLLPLIAALLLWQQREQFERQSFTGSLWGGFLVLLAGGMLLLGTMGGAYTLQQYAFVCALLGLIIGWTGTRVWRSLLIPALLLVLMIPQPAFILENLSTQLQLVSSTLGVAIIRLLGISVYLEGNVIDLGSYRLQVVDACAGLRYLFPLMTLGLLIAYFFRAPLWKRALVFLASIPVTIGLNSVRIAMVGWMVEHWGIGMAEGFIHDFQGWAVFMVSGLLLMGWAALLNRLTVTRRPWSDVFGIDFPEKVPASAAFRYRSPPKRFLVALLALGVVVVAQQMVPNRLQAVPEPPALSSFPSQIAGWVGHREWLGRDVLSTIEVDDYFLASYRRNAGEEISLYVPYYATQRDRRVVHSPAACLPGNGWRIVESRVVQLGESGLRANRMVIANGEQRTLVYYWFQQRGRNITNEWLVKWYLFVDSVLFGRSDGAMVRVMSALPAHENVDAVDRRVRDFISAVQPTILATLPRIPESR